MKRVVSALIFAALTAVAAAQTNDPVLMTIAGKNISKSEFEYIWKKNATNGATDTKSLGDYLKLFVNFKLKVAEAEAQGIDTTQAFKTELTGYRSQLTAPYMTDKNMDEAVARECYNRFRQYVELSHILITVSENATPEDTLQLYRKADSIYKRVLAGDDFAKLATRYSDDASSKSTGGYLGYSVGLRYVYPFETAAYTLPVGSISAPVRTPFGYHILKVQNRVPAGGKYRSAHIMKMVKENATAEEKAAAKDAIFKIYESLKNGEDFKKFATEQSDDRGAAEKGGEYGLMFCGSLPYEYESNVFKLKIGEYSAPFQSRYGWHIVKALEFQPYPSLDEMRNDINSFVAQDEFRSQLSRKALVTRVKKESGYSPVKDGFTPFVKAYEAVRLSKDSTLLKALAKSKFSIFVMNGKVYSQKDFADFLHANSKYERNLNAGYDAFVQEKMLAYEDANLEKKYPEFGHLMQEYRDGTLLFEVSNREVWEKASEDIKGLEAYFKDSVARYAWEKPHYKGILVQCASKSVAEKAKKMLKKLPLDSAAIVLKRTFNTDTTSVIRVEQNVFEQGENAFIDAFAFKKTQPAPDKKFPFAFVSGKVLAKGPESYTDVRGLVISDYQNFLEGKWVESLQKKYTVTIDKEVLNTVNNN